jgi:hypothetical protein
MDIKDLYEYGETSLAVNVPKAKKLKSTLVCPVHKRKVLFKYDYTQAGTNAYITRYCCKEHAQRVAQAFTDAELFDNVYVETEEHTVPPFVRPCGD